MKQASEALNPPKEAFLRLRLLWPFLVLLASFVFFFEFIADVGGTADPSFSPPLPVVTPGSPPANPFPPPGLLPRAEVLQVIDGDTLDVRLQGDTVRLRYYGVDAPDQGEPCYGPAKEANERLVLGTAVHLLADDRNQDEAGLLLRHVLLEDGQSVEASLAAQGLARARREEGSYRDYFTGLEQSAQAGRVGCLWAPQGP